MSCGKTIHMAHVTTCGVCQWVGDKTGFTVLNQVHGKTGCGERPRLGNN